MTDTSGAVVPNAKVVVVNDATGVRYETKTNNDGIYVEPNLPPGVYHIEITREGFKTLMQPGIELHVQDIRAANYTLQVGATSDTVTVQATSYMINTQDATVSTTIDRNFAENLPLNGRSFQTLILLTPGTVVARAGGSNGGEFSVNGQRTDTNNFTVDGVSANMGGYLTYTQGDPAAFLNGTTPSLTIAGTTQGMVSVDALQEFKIQTSTYAPEFGRQPGGQISLLTRSGTNAFHGTAFDYFRNTVLDANTWFNDANGLPKGAEHQNDFGGTIGGPIFKDKTFFFFSYEGLRLLQPITNVWLVPSASLRAETALAFQPLINSIPLPNGPDFGDGTAQWTEDTSQPTNSDTYAIKVDHSFGAHLHLFGRYSDNSSSAYLFSFQGPGNDGSEKLRSRGLTLGADSAISPLFNNEVRLNYTVQKSDLITSLSSLGGAKPFNPSIMFPKPFIQGADLATWNLFPAEFPNVFNTVFVGPAGLNSQRQVQATDTLSYSLGAHQLKWGIDYRRLFPILESRRAEVDYFVLAEADLKNGIASQTEALSIGIAHPIYTNFSVFAQDTWRISRRLTLMYGLRWELNPTPGERDGLDKKFLNLVGLNNPATATVAVGSPYKTTYNNFAPRLGVAYQVRQSPGRETVVRTGVGVFYDLDSSAFAPNIFNNGDRGQNGPFINNLSFPIGDNAVTIPPTSGPLPPPPYFRLPGIDPNLKLPYSLEWNVSVEQGLGQNQSLTASYVASAGYRLLQTAVLANFNPNLVRNVFALRNASSSNYQSLQLQFNRRVSRGFQALASYTYSHSIDNSSDGQTIVSSTAGSQGFPNPNVNKGSSDFDLRHTFRVGATYLIPAWDANHFSRAVLGGWSVDTIGLAQSGIPVDLIGGPALNNWATVRPDLVPGQPLYLYGGQCAAAHQGNPCPGGMGFNPGAFQQVPRVNGFATRQGTLSRNVMRGLDAWQMDFAMHRQFNFTERVNLQFRAELFNIFNHPNFGAPDNRVGAGLFGVANNTLADYYGGLNDLYQIGGPRSAQLALKLHY